MKKPMVRIHNAETNEVIDREMTDEEFAIHQAEIESIQAKDAVAAEIEAKKQAVLAKLGLTSDEVSALLA